MFDTVASAHDQWTVETANTQKMMDALTDASLAVSVSDGHRTLGRMAWHIVVCIPEMMNMIGMDIRSVEADAPLPDTAAAIADGYRKVSGEFLGQLRQWTDDMLQQEDELYGETWKRGKTLMVLMLHEIHHRGQMTVLMRQAGLRIPGIYGPSKEEWADIGAPEPAL